ncbi:GTPase activating protein Ucp3 [Schizosaccharomyces japonicus yFS275]|uniref:GTPase activating protein Ucp3 n=1 Tax=Schizosaccharomyces japonicus (strain yFS275 / FY16936) TaxID=402676 RepID=B6K7L0_SCHJY|nr:GTPase activating protein Ucp3 [Schizosaccharomyces japonicus yFS275]EEB09514.1 GTPase activating protein Ucp3 [Schizosaccharomyces japonicus yFS275]
MSARRNEAVLRDLINSVPGNTYCADCFTKGVQWASWNIGVFLCLRCAGIHRKLGTHVSRVKSISLDEWTQEQVNTMREWGNERANRYWNPNPSKHPLPMTASYDDQAMERYIRDKYERKLFIDDAASRRVPPAPPSLPTRTTSVGSIAPPTNAPPSSSASSLEPALSSLDEMGFRDRSLNTQLLREFNNDLSRVIDRLVNLKTAPSSSSAPSTTLAKPSALKPSARLKRRGKNLHVHFIDGSKPGENLDESGETRAASPTLNPFEQMMAMANQGMVTAPGVETTSSPFFTAPVGPHQPLQPLRPSMTGPVPSQPLGSSFANENVGILSSPQQDVNTQQQQQQQASYGYDATQGVVPQMTGTSYMQPTSIPNNYYKRPMETAPVTNTYTGGNNSNNYSNGYSAYNASSNANEVQSSNAVEFPDMSKLYISEPPQQASVQQQDVPSAPPNNYLKPNMTGMPSSMPSPEPQTSATNYWQSGQTSSMVPQESNYYTAPSMSVPQNDNYGMMNQVYPQPTGMVQQPMQPQYSYGQTPMQQPMQPQMTPAVSISMSNGDWGYSYNNNPMQNQPMNYGSNMGYEQPQMNNGSYYPNVMSNGYMGMQPGMQTPGNMQQYMPASGMNQPNGMMPTNTGGAPQSSSTTGDAYIQSLMHGKH